MALPFLLLSFLLCDPADLQEYQLKELAYAIFLSSTASSASPGLLADLRASLELNEARAAELQRIIELVGRQGVTSLASLEMHVKLLLVRQAGRAGWIGRLGCWAGLAGLRVKLR
jgi:hypothetical protein